MSQRACNEPRAAAHRSRALVRSCAALAGLLWCAGCASNQDQRFIPSEDAAQQALETALAQWQGGKTPPCLVHDGPPALQFVDTHHAAGRKLTAFTILGPTTGDAHRCYAVRLTFDNPSEEVRARFVVLGSDPLWVLRYEDYEMLAHWDHPMPAKLAPAKKS